MSPSTTNPVKPTNKFYELIIYFSEPLYLLGISIIMSGRVSKSRGATASLEAATTTLNERILKVSDGWRWTASSSC